MSAVVITPGKQFSAQEVTDLAKFNALGTPTGVVPAKSITSAELSDALNASLAAATAMIASVVAKSADFTAAVGDKAKLFNITTGASNVTVTLHANTLVNGWYAWFRKADAGAGKVLTSPATGAGGTTPTSIGKPDHLLLIYSDGTDYYVGVSRFTTVDASGNATMACLGNLLLIATGGLIQLAVADATAPALKRSGTTLAVRLGDDSDDAPFSCKGIAYNGRSKTVDIPISGTAIDWSLGDSFYKTLSANTTFTFSNLEDGRTITVELTNTAGNYTVTWPAGITWRAGAAPTQTTGAKTDVWTFKRTNGQLRGFVDQNHS